MMLKRESLGRCVAVAVITAACIHVPAFAGPVEEGVKAYSHAEYSTALKLLTPPAEKGDADAQYTLSLMYLKGEGTSEDKVHAYMWMALSAKSGDPDAVSERDQQEQNLTPEQLTQAKQLLADWKAK
jgi:TPR repeat protein